MLTADVDLTPTACPGQIGLSVGELHDPPPCAAEPTPGLSGSRHQEWRRETSFGSPVSVAATGRRASTGSDRQQDDGGDLQGENYERWAPRYRKPSECEVGHERELTGDEELPQMGLGALVGLVHDAVHRHEPDDHRERTKRHRHGQVPGRLPHQRPDGDRTIHVVPRSQRRADEGSTGTCEGPQHANGLGPCQASALTN